MLVPEAAKDPSRTGVVIAEAATTRGVSVGIAEAARTSSGMAVEATGTVMARKVRVGSNGLANGLK